MGKRRIRSRIDIRSWWETMDQRKWDTDVQRSDVNSLLSDTCCAHFLMPLIFNSTIAILELRRIYKTKKIMIHHYI